MIICLIIINFKSPKNPIVNTHKNVRIRQKHRHHLASKIYHYYSRRRNSISISPFQSARNGTTIIQDLVFFHLLIIICKGGGEKKALIRILIILALLRPPSKGECILYCLCACSNITVGVKSTDGWSLLTKEVEGKFFLICPSDSTIIGTNQCNLIIKDDFLWWKTKNERGPAVPLFSIPRLSLPYNTV